MKIQEFKKMSIKNQFAILSQPVRIDTPFFIERLKTAIDGNISAISFIGGDVTELYYDLVNNLQKRFISEIESKGFELKVYGEDTFLIRNMEAFHIYPNGSIGYSSPSGNLKYNSVEDWGNGKVSRHEEYLIRD